jgi:hypothetical protein
LTIVLKKTRRGQVFAHAARRINVALVVFLLLYFLIGLLQPNYFEPAGAMNFLRRRRLSRSSRLDKSSCW